MIDRFIGGRRNTLPDRGDHIAPHGHVAIAQDRVRGDQGAPDHAVEGS
jgi:hypothetical protein